MDEVRRSHIIRNFVSEDILKLFREYSVIRAMSDMPMSSAGQRIMKHDPDTGNCIDIRYGDPFANGLLLNYREKISQVVGKKLEPIVSFYRVYATGCQLPMHKDTPEYEWSATLCMGYEAPESWPLYIEKEPFYLEAGDCLIYQGAKDAHGRKPFKGSWQSQVFVHYKEVKDGQRQEKNS